MEIMRAILPSFCVCLSSFPPGYRVKDPSEHKWLLEEKKISFQLSFQKVSFLIVDVSERKMAGKWEEVKFNICFGHWETTIHSL